MASNIVPADVNGVGAEANFLPDLALDEQGNPPPFEELEAEHGRMQAYLRLIEHNMAKRAATPRTRGYPPRVFISYRRESAEHIAWCERLADVLDDLGYAPLLDVRAYRSNSPVELASFIGSLIDADICVVVLTASYLGDGHSMRNWLFEEWERIRMLDRWGMIEVVLVLRDGNVANLLGAEALPLRWGLIDLSEDSDGMGVITDYFGEYSGPTLSEDAERQLAAAISPMLQLLSAPDVATNDLATVSGALADLSHWSDTEEYRLAQVMLLVRSGHIEPALTATREFLEGVVTIPTACWLLIRLWIADLELAVFPFIAELSEEPSLWRNSLHSVMGATLIDAGAPISAVNHYSWCIGALADEGLGAYWSRSKGPALVAAGEAATIWRELGQTALADLYSAIAVRLEHENDYNRWLGPLWQESLERLAKLAPYCPQCGALFRAPKVCIRCGLGVAAEAQNCPLCEFPVKESLNLGFCPVCRKTDQGGNVLFNERQPGGRWSLLRRVTTEELNARLSRVVSVDPHALGL